MRLPFLLLATFWISLSWLQFTRFATAEWRRFLYIALIVAGWVMTFLLLRGGSLLVAGPRWEPSQTKPLATLNQMTAGVLVLACVFSGFVVLQELRRFIRKDKRGANGNHQTADSTI
jgi:hypothetical protein